MHGDGRCRPETYVFDHALLPSGWARDVRVDVARRRDHAVTPTRRDGRASASSGLAIPGLPNLHCHAFQRGMAGLAERRGPAHDSFWTWREVMYRFLGRLTPDDAEAIAAFAYMQMLETGFTAVGEFHYLHHDIDGRPYADLGEMAARIAAAASATGIGLTLLPTLYMHGGFGGAAPNEGQKRFLNDPDRYAALLARSREIVQGAARCARRHRAAFAARRDAGGAARRPSPRMATGRSTSMRPSRPRRSPTASRR